MSRDIGNLEVEVLGVADAAQAVYRKSGNGMIEWPGVHVGELASKVCRVEITQAVERLVVAGDRRQGPAPRLPCAGNLRGCLGPAVFLGSAEVILVLGREEESQVADRKNLRNRRAEVDLQPLKSLHRQPEMGVDVFNDNDEAHEIKIADLVSPRIDAHPMGARSTTRSRRIRQGSAKEHSDERHQPQHGRHGGRCSIWKDFWAREMGNSMVGER